jgi:hypothetical protein
MSVPGGAGAGLEGDRVAGGTRGGVGSEQGVYPYRARKPLGRSFAGWLLAAALDFHGPSSR